MAHASESQYFINQRLNSLNSTLNNKEAWKLDIKYAREVEATMERVGSDLEEGILKHAVAKRMQHLESTVADVCYTGNDFNFQQA